MQRHSSRVCPYTYTFSSSSRESCTMCRGRHYLRASFLLPHTARKMMRDWDAKRAKASQLSHGLRKKRANFVPLTRHAHTQSHSRVHLLRTASFSAKRELARGRKGLANSCLGPGTQRDIRQGVCRRDPFAGAHSSHVRYH